MPTAPRVLFVCLGNNCRSPTAEGVLRAMAPHLEVDSAGTGDWHAGKPPYRSAIQAASARGYDLTKQRARQVRSRDFEDFDLILAMDKSNLSVQMRLKPQNSRAEVRLFLDFAPNAGRSDVPDPYYTRDFEGALDLIECASRGLLQSFDD